MILDVSGTVFETRYRPSLPASAVKKTGVRIWFRARSLIDALVAEAKAKTRVPTPVPTDPLLLGSDSPGLERYRQARAGLAEMDLAVRQGTLVPVNELQPALEKCAGVLRRAGETLQRQYGPDAANVLIEAVDETVEAWETILRPPDDPDAHSVDAAAHRRVDEASEASDDAGVR